MFYEHYVLLFFVLFCWIPPSRMGSFVHRMAVHGIPEVCMPVFNKFSYWIIHHFYLNNYFMVILIVFKEYQYFTKN